MIENPAITGARDSRAFSAVKEMILGERPLIYVRTHEESRVERLLHEAASRLFRIPVPVWNWSATLGLQPPGGGSDSERLSAREVLSFILGHPDPAF